MSSSTCAWGFSSVSVHFSFLLLLLFSSLVATSHSAAPHFASSLTFQVEPRNEQCFYEELTADVPFRMEFEVTRGGLLDIRLRVNDPNGLVVIERMAYFNRADEAMNEAEGRVEWTATMSGRYAICFDNSMSRWTAKVVSLFVHNLNPGAAQAAADRATTASAAKLQDLGGMVDSIIKIADQLDEIEKLQHHQRVREQQWRDEGEASDANVQWLTLIEGVLLVGVTVGQLQYIRNWFKETGKTGRV